MEGIAECVDSPDYQRIRELEGELNENKYKRQVFRTETEMLFSVLNDGKFPTAASKYWQSVREQAVHWDELVILSFRFRKNEIKIKRLKMEIANAEDALEAEDKQVDVDECLFTRQSMQIIAKDRVREIDLWSRIKTQCVEDDPSFDTENVNTHQFESYRLNHINRLLTLTPGSSQSEALNVIGPLNTILKFMDGHEPKPIQEWMSYVYMDKKEIGNGTKEGTGAGL